MFPPRAHSSTNPAAVHPPAVAGFARGAPFSTSVAATREGRIGQSGSAPGRTTDTNSARILRLLHDESCTRREIGERLGLHDVVVARALIMLHHARLVTVVGVERCNGVEAALWSGTE